MNNIDQFNAIVAGIFCRLYSEFPKPVHLEVEKLRTELGVEAKDWWQERNGSNPIGSAIEWLQVEGFIRYSSQAHCQLFANVVLTAKGFAALNKVPDALTSKPTIGERIKELSCVMSSEVASSLVRIALGT
jgi:hypothetical protein